MLNQLFTKTTQSCIILVDSLLTSNGSTKAGQKYVDANPRHFVDQIPEPVGFH